MLGDAGAEAGAGPTFSAAELATMLTPGSRDRRPTRGPTPGTGEATAEAKPGNGVVPDLRVTFAFNSAALEPEGRVQLDELAQALQFDQLIPFRFAIGGHTDAVGDAAFNDHLSERRADAVVSYLTSLGIEPGRLQAQGFGERQLVDPTSPSSGVNRRVEVRTVR